MPIGEVDQGGSSIVGFDPASGSAGSVGGATGGLGGVGNANGRAATTEANTGGRLSKIIESVKTFGKGIFNKEGGTEKTPSMDKSRIGNHPKESLGKQISREAREAKDFIKQLFSGEVPLREALGINTKKRFENEVNKGGSGVKDQEDDNTVGKGRRVSFDDNPMEIPLEGNMEWDLVDGEDWPEDEPTTTQIKEEASEPASAEPTHAEIAIKNMKKDIDDLRKLKEKANSTDKSKIDEKITRRQWAITALENKRGLKTDVPRRKTI